VKEDEKNNYKWMMVLFSYSPAPPLLSLHSSYPSVSFLKFLFELDPEKESPDSGSTV
jgi:hypothetical protein